MKKVCVYLLILSLLCSMGGCAPMDVGGVETRNSGMEGNEEEVQSLDRSESTSVPLQIDYAKVMQNSDEYDGKYIQVAGRISGFLMRNAGLKFSERIGFQEKSYAIHDFDIELSACDGNVADSFKAGDYVMVSGIWRGGPYPALQEAQIVGEGDDAFQLARGYQLKWEETRQKEAEKMELWNYMSLAEAGKAHEGEYVKVSGKMSITGKSLADNDRPTIRFKSPESGEKVFDVSLFGCTPESLEKCVDGEYVVLTGKLLDGKIIDCFIESIGEDAKKQDEAAAADRQQRLAEEQEEFINSCVAYSYEEILRYPDDYRGKAVRIDGTVVQVKEYYTYREVDKWDILVSTSYDGGHIVFIEYEAPKCGFRLLENDVISLYGTLDGTETYTTILLSDSTVPRVKGVKVLLG